MEQFLAKKDGLEEKVLRWIADPSYIGTGYLPHEVVEIYRKWAGAALEEQP